MAYYNRFESVLTDRHLQNRTLTKCPNFLFLDYTIAQQASVWSQIFDKILYVRTREKKSLYCCITSSCAIKATHLPHCSPPSYLWHPSTRAIAPQKNAKLTCTDSTRLCFFFCLTVSLISYSPKFILRLRFFNLRKVPKFLRRFWAYAESKTFSN